MADKPAASKESPESPREDRSQDAAASPSDQKESSDQDELVASLPPVESLTAESDFTPFLDRAVPAELRRLALRKLWLSDPVFANLDGLNDYDDDFRSLGVGKLVRTAYQVGKGMVTRAEQASEKTRAQDSDQDPRPADEPSDSDQVATRTSPDNDDTDTTEDV